MQTCFRPLPGILYSNQSTTCTTNCPFAFPSPSEDPLFKWSKRNGNQKRRPRFRPLPGILYSNAPLVSRMLPLMGFRPLPGILYSNNVRKEVKPMTPQVSVPFRGSFIQMLSKLLKPIWRCFRPLPGILYSNEWTWIIQLNTTSFRPLPRILYSNKKSAG